ncbi:hypothetical protein SL040_004519 [Aeromonas salmonicida]|nr:hypothetical protein [Aeromonas salmonicida]ELY2004145.1 hypothetical protein [Aeromonas salmonicida]
MAKGSGKGSSGSSKGSSGGSKGASSSSKGASNNNRNGSSQGASAGNRGSTSSSSSSSKGAASSKSGGASSSGSKGASSSTSRGGPSSIGGGSSYGMSKGSFNNSIGANNKGQQATSGNGKNDNNSVASRIASVSKTLSTYKATSTPPNHNISSIGGPSMYGMSEDQYNKTINTDNYNGVIGNLQQKAQRGTLSEADRGALGKAAQDYNGLRGAGVVGATLAGTPGKWSAQKLAGAVMGEPGDYLSGMTRKAATGQLDDKRLSGQRDKLGDGGGLDSALKGALSLVGMMAPGAGMVTSAIGSGLTVGAPGHGALLNDLNVQAGNAVSQAGASHSNGNGGGKGDTASAPPRYSLPSNSDLDKSMAGDFNFNPSRFDVTPGIRAQYAWDGE